MSTWQKSFTREPPKTKAELRETLTEAVRNTQVENMSWSRLSEQNLRVDKWSLCRV
jgi:hypothetical protein